MRVTSIMSETGLIIFGGVALLALWLTLYFSIAYL